MKRVIVIVSAIVMLLSCSALFGCKSNDIADSIPVDKTLTAEEVFELVSPSVVGITCETVTGISTGTGFFYDNHGTVITNFHVIEDCDSAKITLTNGESYTVIEVKGHSEEKDIAILSTDCPDSVPLSIRETHAKTGETVYAVGNSLGILTNSFSNGIVSSAERNGNDVTYIQTTAPMSAGNSGGPLVDKDGKVIGINTWGFTEGQNLNFAVSASEIITISTDNPQSLFALFGNRFIFAIEDNFPPFSWCENGKYYGLHVDIARELAKRANRRAIFVTVKYDDLIPGVRAGIYDMAFGVSRTPEREKWVSFTSCYYEDMAAIFHTEGESLTFGEWTIYRKKWSEMIDDGTLDALLEKYNLN